MAIIAKLTVYKEKGASADSAEVQAIVAKLQARSTENYYNTITDVNLKGGGMKELRLSSGFAFSNKILRKGL